MYNWDEIIDEFLIEIEIRGYAEQTIYNYSTKLINIKDYFTEQGIKYIDDVTKQDVKKWIAEMQKKGMQASTINVTRNRLSKVYDHMIEEDYIQKNPCAKVKKLRVQKKIVYPLDDYEIKQMLNLASKHKYKHVAQRDVTMFSMMLECGLRISEVANLKNEDVLENQIIIRNSKFNKDRALAITPILKKQMLKYDRIKKNRYKTDDYQYYFVSYQLCKLSEKSIWDMMQEIKKQMDVRNVVRFSGHTLRHTYAHMAMRNGMDIYTLSMNMGHSSVVMTQKYLQTLKSDDFVEKSVQYSTLKNLR